MKLSRLSITALAVAVAGAVTLAQTPPAGATAAPKAASAPMHAQAVIKGEGISGTADFTEHSMGTGKMANTNTKTIT